MNINNNNNKIQQHNHRVYEKVIVSDNKENRYEEPYKSPHQITKVWKNGTHTIHQDAVQEHINIKIVRPCHE